MTDTFPSWRYGPDGESGVFNSADDVPKGWKDHPKAQKPEETERRPSRAEFQKQLKTQGIPFDPTMSAAQLERLLVRVEEAEPPKAEEKDPTSHGPPPDGPTHVVEEPQPAKVIPPDFAPPAKEESTPKPKLSVKPK